MKNVETTKSVKYKLPSDHFPFPNGYYRSGANKKLPFNLGSIIGLASLTAIEGGTKEELINEFEALYYTKNDEMFVDFSNPKTEFDNELDKEEYEFQYKRESEIKTELEKHGYKFPTNIREGVDLLIELGLIFEEEKDGEIYIDVLISPYPTAEELLKRSR